VVHDLAKLGEKSVGEEREDLGCCGDRREEEEKSVDA